MPDASIDDVRAEAVAFFESCPSVRSRTERLPDEGRSPLPDVYSYMRPRGHQAERDELRAACAWRADLHDAGLAWIDGPVEHGGRGLTAEHVRAVDLVAESYDVPSTALLTVNLDIVLAAVMLGGDDGQKARWVTDLVRGSTVWCQLFSEPEAGSDLAALRTTAVQEASGRWRIRGQKVWSSGAHYSDMGLLLARTGRPAERGRGLTLFAIDMNQPGVEVRPLRQMSGAAHFNEVFLDDAWVDDADLLGHVGEGWNITAGVLNSERSAAGEQVAKVVIQPTENLIGAAEAVERLAEPSVRSLVAESWIREQIMQQLLREPPREEDGGVVAASILKLLVGDDMRFLVESAGQILGWRMIADSDRPSTYAWSQLLLNAPAHRIAGGTDEIQKNILAERVLGLPREPRVERSNSIS